MSDLLRNIPRGIANQADDDMIAPRALWYTEEHIANQERGHYAPNKIFLGKAGYAYIGNDDDRHQITVAGSRSGKGRSCIIPNLLHYSGSTLVIDPKGENANVTALRRQALGQKVFVLDPFGRTKPHCAPFKAAYNPLSILTPDNPFLIDDCALIADALVVTSDRDPHWDESARTLIEGIILHVVTSPNYEVERNLMTVYRLLMRGETVTAGGETYSGMNGLHLAMRTNSAQGGAVADSAADFFEKAEKERSSVLSTARRHLRFMRSAQMKDVLSGHDFDLTYLHSEDTTIYLCLPATRISTHSRWLRMFINLALEALERVPKRADKPPVLLVLDEFPALGHMSTVEDAAGQIAGFGVKLWPIIQDLGQLQSLYKERWETFLGNSGVIQCFGNNEPTTTEWISKRLGKTSFQVVRKSDQSVTQAATGASGDSWATETHDLLTSEEVARFFARETGRQIIIRNGAHAIALRRCNYDQHPFFSQHAKEQP